MYLNFESRQHHACARRFDAPQGHSDGITRRDVFGHEEHNPRFAQELLEKQKLLM